MTNTNTRKVKYVVVRDNIRVSETEYDNESDAQGEVAHWNRVITRWPDGTKIKVVEKDNRIHRTYTL